jgi:subtilisin family serine protease
MKAIQRRASYAAIPVGALLGLAVFSAGFAEPRNEQATPAVKRQKTYIVQMANDPIATYEGRIAGLAATKAAPGQKLNPQSQAYRNYAAHLEKVHDEVLASVGGGNKVYDYNVVFNGFAAVLTPGQAEMLRAQPGVLNVWEDEKLKPHTQSTPRYLRLTGGGGPWSNGIVGENIIIGMIDSGVQPDHPSLADVPTHKKGDKGPKIPYGAAPAGWTGTGCDFGNTAFNPNDAPFTCNNKLLKAQSFSEGFLLGADPAEAFADGEFLSARDSDGHGTHTTTTAGGNNGVPAEIDGEPVGNVSGMAPRARIATYKVCWEAPDADDSGCASSDSMAAIDQAVEDGVDVINFSIGGLSPSFTSPDDIAFLFAADAGVFVAVSAGNDGPNPATIGSPTGVPWVTATGASEDNENFGTGLQVNAPASIAALYEGIEGAGPVTLAETGDITASVVPAAPLNGCTAVTNGALLADQIALVIRGVCNFDVKYNNVAAAGARAIVVYQDGAAPDRFDPFIMAAPDTTIPGIMIGFDDGNLINTTSTGSTVNGTLSPTIQIPRNNRITGFSSRGPNVGAPDIIKPDVAAPGVNIIAGETLFPNANAAGGEFFQFLSGTSMASPHTAGVFALLRQAHPDWTPAIARSALMTTARQNLKKSFGDDKADPFDIGAGFIVPREAFSPGLAYDAGFLDYVAFLCGAENQAPVVAPATCAALEGAGFSLDSSELNLPSIGIAELVGSETITRTVTNLTNHRTRYEVSVKKPAGVGVQVSPQVLRLGPGESASYEVTFTVKRRATFNQWVFGSLEWCSNQDTVRSPIAVRPVALDAPAELRASGSPGSLTFDVRFGYTGTYQAAMDGLTPGVRATGTVNDSTPTVLAFAQRNFNVPTGTTLARFALYDEDIGATNDFDMQVFFFNGTSFVFVGQSAGGTSEEEVNVVDPAPGIYAVLVIDFATAPGPTPFALFNYNLNGADAGNTTLTLPASAVSATTGSVTVDWTGLPADTRSLGRLNHSDGVSTLATTEILVNTQ